MGTGGGAGMTVWAGRPLGLLISGVLALFIAMGVGRFAYTPILRL